MGCTRLMDQGEANTLTISYKQVVNKRLWKSNSGDGGDGIPCLMSNR